MSQSEVYCTDTYFQALNIRTLSPHSTTAERILRSGSATFKGPQRTNFKPSLISSSGRHCQVVILTLSTLCPVECQSRCRLTRSLRRTRTGGDRSLSRRWCRRKMCRPSCSDSTSTCTTPTDTIGKASQQHL